MSPFRLQILSILFQHPEFLAPRKTLFLGSKFEVYFFGTRDSKKSLSKNEFERLLLGSKFRVYFFSTGDWSHIQHPSKGSKTDFLAQSHLVRMNFGPLKRSKNGLFGSESLKFSKNEFWIPKKVQKRTFWLRVT